MLSSENLPRSTVPFWALPICMPSKNTPTCWLPMLRILTVLSPPDASVILYLYAGEVAERIGHVVAVQLFERLAFEFLGGDDFGCPPCRDDDFLDVVRTVHREGVCRMLRPGAAGEGQQEQQACTDCRPSSPVTYGGSGQR